MCNSKTGEHRIFAKADCLNLITSVTCSTPDLDAVFYFAHGLSYITFHVVHICTDPNMRHLWNYMWLQVHVSPCTCSHLLQTPVSLPLAVLKSRVCLVGRAPFPSCPSDTTFLDTGLLPRRIVLFPSRHVLTSASKLRRSSVKSTLLYPWDVLRARRRR